MTWWNGLLVALLSAGAAVWPSQGNTAPIDDLIAAAKKEGAVEFFAAGTLGAEGAQKLGEAFNKKYGLNIKTLYHPSSGMARDIAKVITIASAGLPSEWDVMLATDAHHASLWLRKLQKPFDYKSLGVDEKLIDHDGGAISFAHQYIVPAYNSSLVAPKDAPKSWEDLLQAKWKGKVGVTTATHHLGRLAFGPWGEEKTTAYVKALAQQNPVVGELGPTYTRLQLGEILVALSLTDSYIHVAKQTGAPITEAVEVQPVVAPSYHAGALKGAQHPHAAHLFAVFMTLPESQQVWERTVGVSSALIPGTAYYQKSQGKQMIYLRKDQSDKVESLARTYGKMIGLL